MEIRKTTFVALFLAVFLVSGVTAQAAEQQAPAFELTTLDGKKITQDDLSNKVTLMVFWAASCGTCKKELPKIRDLQEKMGPRGFQVLAVGFADPEADIRHYVASHARTFNFPVFHDTGNRVATRWGVSGTPTLFLVDKRGSIVISHPGGGLLESASFHRKLNEML